MSRACEHSPGWDDLLLKRREGKVSEAYFPSGARDWVSHMYGMGSVVPSVLKSNTGETFLTLHQRPAFLARVINQETVAWLFPEWLDLYHRKKNQKCLFANLQNRPSSSLKPKEALK